MHRASLLSIYHPPGRAGIRLSFRRGYALLHGSSCSSWIYRRHGDKFASLFDTPQVRNYVSGPIYDDQQNVSVVLCARAHSHEIREDTLSQITLYRMMDSLTSTIFRTVSNRFNRNSPTILGRQDKDSTIRSDTFWQPHSEILALACGWDGHCPIGTSRRKISSPGHR
jgi:hypothetical protein